MSCKTVIIEASGQSPPGPKPSVVAVGLFRFFEVLLVCLLLSVFMLLFFAFQATDGTHTALYTHTFNDTKWLSFSKYGRMTLISIKKCHTDLKQK